MAVIVSPDASAWSDSASAFSADARRWMATNVSVTSTSTLNAAVQRGQGAATQEKATAY